MIIMTGKELRERLLNADGTLLRNQREDDS